MDHSGKILAGNSIKKDYLYPRIDSKRSGCAKTMITKVTKDFIYRSQITLFVEEETLPDGTPSSRGKCLINTLNIPQFYSQFYLGRFTHTHLSTKR